MKKALSLVLALITLLFCLGGCTASDEYNYEQFYGVVRFSDELNRLIVYIPKIGETEIPQNEGCCSCFDGHEPNEDYSYQLKAGDLIKINFKYEKAWDDNGVCVMETYPAKFDRNAGLIEVLRENIELKKNDTGYVFSFPSTEELESTTVGDKVYFIYHEGKNGFDKSVLYATGEIIAKVDDIITVSLTIHEEESEFLEKYCSMSVELTWDK